MKKIMLIATITTLLVACGKETAEPTAVTPSTAPAILSYIPADTPLLILSGTNSDQYPARYTEVMQTNMNAAVKYFKLILNEALSEHQNMTEKLEQMAAESASDESEALTSDADQASTVETVVSESELMKQKVKTFVDRWFDADNMDKIGLKMEETQLAMYTVDLFPVLRVKLSAGHQIPAMLTDLETQFDLPITTIEMDGMQVREMVADQLTILIATEGDTLVVSGAPTVIKDQMIGQLLGSTKPTESLAQNPALINQVKSAHGYTVDDVMLVNFQQLADYFIYPAKHNSSLVNFLQIDDNMLSAVCKTEMSDMLSKAPRMVAGTKTLTDDTIEASFVWEMDATVATDMAQMMGRVPHGNDDATFAFGMSFDLLNAKNLATKYVNAMVEQPYACEHFAMMNQKATELQAKLSQPIPPFVGNLKGFNFSMDELELNLAAANADNPNPKDVIESLKAQMFFAVDETQALLGMAQMMLPQLQEMNIKTDGSLITLADQIPLISGKDIPFDVKNLYAAVSDDTLGVSLGHADGGSLSDKVKTAGQSALITSYADADGYRDLMEQIFAVAEMPGMPESLKEELKLQKELTLNMLYWQSQSMVVKFNQQGLTTDIDIKY